MKALAEGGADLRATDTSWGKTPRDWAEYSRGDDERGRRYGAIGDFLKSLEGR